MNRIFFALLFSAASFPVFADSTSELKLETLMTDMHTYRHGYCDNGHTLVVEHHSKQGGVAYELMAKGQHFMVVEETGRKGPMKYYFSSITYTVVANKLVWDSVLETTPAWKAGVGNMSPDFLKFYFSPKETHGCKFGSPAK